MFLFWYHKSLHRIVILSHVLLFALPSTKQSEIQNVQNDDSVEDGDARQRDMDTVLLQPINLYFLRNPKDISKVKQLDSLLQKDDRRTMFSSLSQLNHDDKTGQLDSDSDESRALPTSIRESKYLQQKMNPRLKSRTESEFQPSETINQSPRNNDLEIEEFPFFKSIMNTSFSSSETPNLNVDANQENEIRNRLRRKRKNMSSHNKIVRDLSPKLNSPRRKQAVNKTAENIKQTRSYALTRNLVNIPSHAQVPSTKQKPSRDKLAVSDTFLYAAVITAAVLTCLIFTVIGIAIGKNLSSSKQQHSRFTEEENNVGKFNSNYSNQINSQDYASKMQLQNCNSFSSNARNVRSTNIDGIAANKENSMYKISKVCSHTDDLGRQSIKESADFRSYRLGLDIKSRCKSIVSDSGCESLISLPTVSSMSNEIVTRSDSI